jgi:catechol 2,3-dioxygenase
MAIRRTGHVALRVRDLEAARHFYHDILGMRIGEEWPGRAIFFRFNDYHHDIVVFKATDDAEPASQRHAGAAHIAFLADDFETVRNTYRRLRDNDVRVRCTDHGFTKSVYFNDPDGIELEVYAEVPEFDWRKEGLGKREPFDMEDLSRSQSKTAPG